MSWELSEKFRVRTLIIYDEKNVRDDDKMCCCCRFRWLVGAQTKEYAHPYSMMHRRLTTAGIEVAPHYHQLLVMRRASEASLFFLGFPRKKKPLHNGSYEHRVPKIKNQTLFCTRDVCLFVWSNIVIGHLCRPYSTHTAPMPVLTGSVHAHICLLYTSPSPRD